MVLAQIRSQWRALFLAWIVLSSQSCIQITFIDEMLISVSMLIQATTHAPSGSYLQMVPGTLAQQGSLLDYEQDHAGHDTHCQPGWYAGFILRSWARWEHQYLMDWTTEDSLFFPPPEQQIFLPYKKSWPPPGPTQLRVGWYSEEIYPGLKRLDREPYHWPPHSNEVKTFLLPRMPACGPQEHLNVLNSGSLS